MLEPDLDDVCWEVVTWWAEVLVTTYRVLIHCAITCTRSTNIDLLARLTSSPILRLPRSLTRPIVRCNHGLEITD